jgi:hypothetical protein
VKLRLVFLAAVTIGSTWALAHYMKMDGFAFAWALNFLLMLCVFAFTETIGGQLTSSYYRQKGWERGGRLYELLGINLFRKLLVLIGWEKLNKKATPVNKRREALIHLHHQTKKSELGHAIVFVIVLGFNVVVAYRFGLVHSAWLLILNVMLNLYPVFLQRYNRPRIERTINVRARR